MNKAFSPEELAEIREDWKRNGDLGTEDRLERVAQLHACGQASGTDHRHGVQRLDGQPDGQGGRHPNIDRLGMAGQRARGPV